MTQAELAERLGVGNDSLSRIEKGVVAPRFQRLEKIAEVLECTVSELFVCRHDEFPEKIAVIEDALLQFPHDTRSEVLKTILNLMHSFQKVLTIQDAASVKCSAKAPLKKIGE